MGRLPAAVPSLSSRLNCKAALRAACAAAALSVVAISGCGGGPAAPPLGVSTSSIPDGHIGSAYSASLVATGGKSPYTWSLTSGKLPAGLTLNGVAGLISGTPTAAVSSTPLAFSVNDSGSPVQSAPFSAHLNVWATVTVSPARAAVVTGQALAIVPTTNDPTGVNWSVTGTSCSGAACGTLSATNSLGGIAVTYTAHSAAGVYTVKAVSAGDGTTSSSATVAVTDLGGVITSHNDLNRDGANVHEYGLDPAKISATTFGKLFSCTVDGAIYAQPLWVPKLTIAGSPHNVVFVATQHDSLYAFDGDTNTSPCTPLWHVNLIDSAHEGLAGEVAVPSAVAGGLLGAGYGDIVPEVGVTGTPVIDLSTNTLYVVSKSAIVAGPTFYQRLHAIDLVTGSEKFSGPATISGTYPGTGDGSLVTTFVARMQNQRPGLALSGGVVYIAWSSHEDKTPYYGWVMGYDASNLGQVAVVNVSPNVGWGGIWMDGDAPAIDAAGNLYITIGNAVFDATSATAPNNDFGDSFLKLSSTLGVSQYFTPSDQANDNQVDADFGSGGATLIDLPANGGNPTHLVAGGGKDGFLYLLNRDHMGGFGDSNAWQRLSFGSSIFATGAYWNSTLYMAGNGGHLQAFPLSAGSGNLSLSPSSFSAATFGFPGSSPSVSSLPDNSNGIVWALDNSSYCTPQSPSCGPAILHAYEAGNLATEIWNSTMGTGNAAGYAVKFTVPTVANGRVYMGTRGNNPGGEDNTTSKPGELEVYGMLPN